jgi:hypothetical protein
MRYSSLPYSIGTIRTCLITGPSVLLRLGVVEYPYWVWTGTLFEDFATLCGEKNVIPREFFIEAVKTVVGAICGHRIFPEGIESQESRFYTVLIGPGGGGKSSASKWARDLFIGTGFLYQLGQEPAFSNIGVAEGCFSSGEGLIKKGFDKHSRILMPYDELTTLIEKFAILGSGFSLMNFILEAFERTSTAPTSITKNDKITNTPTHGVHLSILGCSTAERWENSFVKTGAESSGFFQRVNIISNPSEETVARLHDPDFSALREKFQKKIQSLEFQKANVIWTAEAVEAFDSWYLAKNTEWRSLHKDIKGRISVIAQRNASLLAWLMGGDDVVPNADKANEPIEIFCDADIVARAIALAEYEVFVRQIHQPILADNPWAKMECAIRRYFVKTKKTMVTRKKLGHDLHADRAGIQTFDKAINNLTQEGFLKIGQREGETKCGRKAQIIMLVVD